MAEPRYLSLFESGELARRAARLEARLLACDICPRRCGINRLLDAPGGFCHTGRLPVVASVCDHHGEEPAISGSKGSGAVFFASCNLRCLYCQNHQISQDWDKQRGKVMEPAELARRLIYVQDELGCHNINFVSPSHFAPQLVRAVLEAVPLGLHIPLVYNSNAYDSVGTLAELDGIIDIYLPDLKYSSDEWANKLSQAEGYVEHSRQAIIEMYRQVGDLMLDESGLAERGLIVRHLILPNDLAGSRASLSWLATAISPSVTVSVMSQYYPAHRAKSVPLLARTITVAEYRAVVKLLDVLGLENGWLQEMESKRYYLPDFDRDGHPFLARPQD